MIKVGEDTVMVGATEFRSAMPKLINSLPEKKIIIMKRGKPVAVFQDFDEYKEQEDWKEGFEDLVLGYLAMERDKNASEDDFMTFDEVFGELNLSDE